MINVLWNIVRYSVVIAFALIVILLCVALVYGIVELIKIFKDG